MSQYFIGSISLFRRQLSCIVIDNNTYENLNIKIKFYYMNDSKYTPKESCLAYLYRTVISKKPSVYSYNYSVSSPQDSYFDEMVYAIKQRFGYAIRNASSNHYFFSPRRNYSGLFLYPSTSPRLDSKTSKKTKLMESYKCTSSTSSTIGPIKSNQILPMISSCNTAVN